MISSMPGSFVDPITAAYYTAALAPGTPQGWFGSPLSQIGQPQFGQPGWNPIGTALATPALVSPLTSIAAGQGRYFPYQVDPITAAYAAAQQLTPQGWLGNPISQWGQPQLGPQPGSPVPTPLGSPAVMSPFVGVGAGQARYPYQIDPMTALLYSTAQQQLVPQQGWFGQPPWGQSQIGQPQISQPGGIPYGTAYGSPIGAGQFGQGWPWPRPIFPFQLSQGPLMRF